MKTFLVVLMLLASTGTALAQEQASVKFRWAQPFVNTAGDSMSDGQIKEYRIYIATELDTIMQGRVEAPTVLADSAWAYARLDMGMPSTVAVQAIDKWDNLGLMSPWSDINIVVPDPPGAPSKPGSFD